MTNKKNALVVFSGHPRDNDHLPPPDDVTTRPGVLEELYFRTINAENARRCAEAAAPPTTTSPKSGAHNAWRPPNLHLAAPYSEAAFLYWQLIYIRYIEEVGLIVKSVWLEWLFESVEERKNELNLSFSFESSMQSNLDFNMTKYSFQSIRSIGYT